ncbi:reverse transcriptase family protein [Azoarcus sp. KH32C]|uniref:reverse transcriptase family protein n=1 Tax=Azoarcus sp. KH32C TaxID=748247 RepID=UPI000A02D54A|nr:reverse transcriptase family protein [Azoarcus sp. KH32C]
MLYTVSRIPKGRGKFREIYIPSSEYRLELRSMLPVLDEILSRLDIYKFNYAFQKNRNCALNALQHIGYKCTLSMDLEGFFDSITPAHLSGLVPDNIIERCFINGHPRQGLPTSPAISNIAFLECDKQIILALQKLSIKIAYTRYADDLTVSFDDKKDSGKIKCILQQAAERCGFKINHQKTKLQESTNGRVVITGIAVDRNGLHATRRTKKNLRAAIHQQNKASVNGLTEWSRCKLPNDYFV